MAWSLTGPAATENASPTAPRPRPPQPMSARRIVLFSAACTHGTPVAVRTTPAATAAPSLSASRREAWGSVRFVGAVSRFMAVLLVTVVLTTWDRLPARLFHRQAGSLPHVKASVCLCPLIISYSLEVKDLRDLMSNRFAGSREPAAHRYLQMENVRSRLACVAHLLHT
jgi:hypothetical protein